MNAATFQFALKRKPPAVRAHTAPLRPLPLIKEDGRQVMEAALQLRSKGRFGAWKSVYVVLDPQENYLAWFTRVRHTRAPLCHAAASHRPHDAPHTASSREQL
jgi:hypothetical protein